jgi:HEAT repeat protein
LRLAEWDGLGDALLSVINHDANNDRFRSWATQHLYNLHETSPASEQTHLAAVLASLVDHKLIRVRREALLSIARIGDHQAVTIAVRWLATTVADPMAAHDLAIRVIREQEAREYIELVRSFAYSADVPTRIAALVTLSAWGDALSRDAMLAAASLDDVPANSRLRRAGQMAVERLDAGIAAP